MSSLNKAPRCEHTKIDGTPCRSPAEKPGRFCFFHARWQRQYIDFDHKHAGHAGIEMPVLEDANSIQYVLSQVMQLLLTDQIDTKKAGLLLYALQTASSNLVQMQKAAINKMEGPDGPSPLLAHLLGVDLEDMQRLQDDADMGIFHEDVELFHRQRQMEREKN